jgi:hypothetical protein
MISCLASSPIILSKVPAYAHTVCNILLLFCITREVFQLGLKKHYLFSVSVQCATDNIKNSFDSIRPLCIIYVCMPRPRLEAPLLKAEDYWKKKLRERLKNTTVIQQRLLHQYSLVVVVLLQLCLVLCVHVEISFHCPHVFMVVTRRADHLEPNISQSV